MYNIIYPYFITCPPSLVRPSQVLCSPTTTLRFSVPGLSVTPWLTRQWAAVMTYLLLMMVAPQDHWGAWNIPIEYLLFKSLSYQKKDLVWQPVLGVHLLATNYPTRGWDRLSTLTCVQLGSASSAPFHQVIKRKVPGHWKVGRYWSCLAPFHHVIQGKVSRHWEVGRHGSSLSTKATQENHGCFEKKHLAVFSRLTFWSSCSILYRICSFQVWLR